MQNVSWKLVYSLENQLVTLKTWIICQNNATLLHIYYTGCMQSGV